MKLEFSLNMLKFLKINSLLNPKYIIGLCILISRITGLLRELFIAYIFGTAGNADVVNTAFKLPNLFRRIFGEGALASVFIPEYTKRRVISDIKSKDFASEIFSILFVSLIILVLIMQIFMPYLIYFIVPGFSSDPDQLKLAILLCRITIPYLLLISISALFGGMLNSIGKYGPFAFAPVFLNLSIIIFTVVTENLLNNMIAISISIVVAGLLQIGFVYFFIKFYKINFKWSLPQINDDTKTFIRKLGPAIISGGIVQLSIFISHSIASFFPGAISILSYADRIYQLPLSIIGVTFSTTLLPELSSLYQKGLKKEAILKQNHYIKLASLLSFPCAFGIYILSHPLIYIIYQRGAFTNNDTIMTASILGIFAIGLPAFILNKILMQSFYANGDTKNPMKVTMYSLLINVILNILLIIKFDYFGIALGTSISAWISIIIQIIYLKKYNLIAIKNSTYIYIFKSNVASLIMLFMVYFSFFYTGNIIYTTNSILYKILALSLSIVLGIIIYFSIVFIFGMFKKQSNINLLD
jgi:putative peptidoglycan lipid II flippase